MVTFEALHRSTYPIFPLIDLAQVESWVALPPFFQGLAGFYNVKIYPTLTQSIRKDIGSVIHLNQIIAQNSTGICDMNFIFLNHPVTTTAPPRRSLLRAQAQTIQIYEEEGLADAYGWFKAHLDELREN